ncbi:MAG: alpha-1,2-fucosyltransferase [Flavobacterium sp.]
MITYSKIGKKGNLGNQLFQIASTIGVGVENNLEFSFLEWKYQKYFKNELPILKLNSSDFKNIEEVAYHYHKLNLKDENYDLSGWLQSEKYFDKDLTKHYFEFSESLINSIKSKYQEVLQKRTILISIRRGDFVNHLDYFQLPIKYYMNALLRFFPEWQLCNLIVLSDDIKYCKFHFSFLENVFFGDGLTEVEQLCLGTMCDDFIISNSTFSWWSAWLGEKKDSKIIRPPKNFDGLKAVELNDKDYFPERWTIYNHLEDKIKLKSTAFQIDSKKNSEILKNYILNYFDTTFMLNNETESKIDKIYVFEKDYIFPPFLIYYTSLKLDISNYNIVENNVIKVFKVSKRLNYAAFLVQSDFGLFSEIFSTSNKKRVRSFIYIKSSSNVSETTKDSYTINTTAGQFCNIGGYEYSFKQYIKRKKNKIKKSIKKIFT